MERAIEKSRNCIRQGTNANFSIFIYIFAYYDIIKDVTERYNYNREVAL